MQDRSPLSLRRQWRSADHPNPGPGPCSGALARRDVPERKESNQGLIFVCEWRCATTAKCYSNNRANCRFQWGNNTYEFLNFFNFFLQFLFAFLLGGEQFVLINARFLLDLLTFQLIVLRFDFGNFDCVLNERI